MVHADPTERPKSLTCLAMHEMHACLWQALDSFTPLLLMPSSSKVGSLFSVIHVFNTICSPLHWLNSFLLSPHVENLVLQKQLFFLKKKYSEWQSGKFPLLNVLIILTLIIVNNWKFTWLYDQPSENNYRWILLSHYVSSLYFNL